MTSATIPIPNMSQIETWSSSIYAWYQEFEFEFEFDFFFFFKRKNFNKKTLKSSNKNYFFKHFKIIF
jgi:hypothetical protein